jgi:transcriptional regulator with XRE-family HTH domain
MGNPGTRLREARQLLGLTIEQIAGSTKLSTRTIDDIEHGRFDRLPRGISGRAHVRTYARALGLDADAVVTAYVLYRFGDAGEALPIDRPPPVEGETHPERLLLIEVAAIAVAVAVFFTYRHASAPPGDVLRVESSSDRIVPATAEGASAPEAAFATEHELLELRLDVRPDGPCWISVTADDEVVVRRLLHEGDGAVAVARDEFVVRVGDPETFVYWINGRRGLQLGEAGKPVTVQITRGNYNAFLADSAATDGQTWPANMRIDMSS